MINSEKMGARIAVRRRECGLTGERLAEMVGVSPQAVSKWETGKSLPDTSILPMLAAALGVSIDHLLLPPELRVIKAIYTDGVQRLDVTQTVAAMVRGRRLAMMVNAMTLQVPLESERLKLLLVTCEGSHGLRHVHALEDSALILEADAAEDEAAHYFQIVGAYYGSGTQVRDVMTKMTHYDYFQWQDIRVDHERFPSAPDADGTEYLTLIYRNAAGIFAISCAEGETLRYEADGLVLKDISAVQLEGIPVLAWEQGMDCTFAGAMYAALKAMGEPYSYEEIMGMSGACYRLAFTKVWDWSATDAQVAYNFAAPLFKAIGYEQCWSSRLEKHERPAERMRIAADLRAGKPVLGINLRIAPEWGVICGYREQGKTLLCRTYFDRPYLNAQQDYLEMEAWPFLIIRFGKKLERPMALDTLKASLHTLAAVWEAPPVRGYAQGHMAYTQWIEGLRDEGLWSAPSSSSDIERRLGVNDALLLNLIDARRCAAAYLKASAALMEGEQAQAVQAASERYQRVFESLAHFRQMAKAQEREPLHYNDVTIPRNASQPFRHALAEVLESAAGDEAWVVQRLRTAALV